MNKKLWSYIKGRRKDKASVCMLRVDNRETSDQEAMVNILNRRYVSVFTDEDVSTILDKGKSNVQDMPQIKLTTKGI